MKSHLLTARFVADKDAVEAIKQQLPDAFRAFCDETRSGVFQTVDHQELPDGKKAAKGKSFVTIRLKTEVSGKDLKDLFASAAHEANSQLDADFISTSHVQHLINEFTQGVRHIAAADNQAVWIEAPIFFR